MKLSAKGKIKLHVLIMGLLIVVVFVGTGIAKFAYNKNSAHAASSLLASSTTSSVRIGSAITGAKASGTASATMSTNAISSSSSGTSNSEGTDGVATSPPPTTGHAVGVAMGGELFGLDSADLNSRLDAISALGATWVRFDVEWGDVQYNSPNSSDWSGYDTIINAINAHHLHALGIIAYTPQWARTSTCTGGADCPPANPAQFAKFAQEVATRYSPMGVHDWEIWNEPNNFNFWATKTNCVAYTALLKATYPAIKSVDPSATIITGGLSPESTDDVNISPTDFLTCIYANGGKNYFDAVGDHPYTFPQFPSQSNTDAWAEMSETSPSLRSIMIANGDSNKKIWLTEFGAPTNGPDANWYVSESQQAAMATDAFTLYNSYSWAGPIFWYTLRDGGTTTDTNENFFGLTRYDGSLKPAYTTIQQIIASL